MNTVRSLVNLIAVCGLGTFLGILVMLLLTFFPYWKNLNAEAFTAHFGLIVGHIMRNIGVVILPTLLSLTASLWLGWATPSRWLWLAATVCIAMLLTVTAFYFEPKNSVFTSGKLPPENTGPALTQWGNLHIIRVDLALGATVCAAQAFSL